MQLRRALLLFAIVLGIAAIATSVSRPRGDRSEPAQAPPSTTPVAEPRPETGAPREITFEPAAKPPTKRLEAGRAATVIVEVGEAGLVEIDGLGLTASAEPLTPARLDVLTRNEESYRITLRPARSGETRTIGTLAIEPAGAGR
jgi:hypothetical protein